MSYFNRQRAIVSNNKAIAKSQADPIKMENIMKGEACDASAAASQASGEAWQSGAQPQSPPPAADEIKAHKAAAAAHDAADKAHVAAGKEAQGKNAHTVAAAHFQQAKQHFQSKQHHEAMARDAQDSKDQGYRS